MSSEKQALQDSSLIFLLDAEQGKRNVRITTPVLGRTWKALLKAKLIQVKFDVITNYWVLTEAGREKARQLKKEGVK